MPRDMNRLLDEIVFLEVVDAKHAAMNAGKYLMTARSVRRIVERELGALPMTDFVTTVLPTLQTTAALVLILKNIEWQNQSINGIYHCLNKILRPKPSFCRNCRARAAMPSPSVALDPCSPELAGSRLAKPERWPPGSRAPNPDFARPSA